MFEFRDTSIFFIGSIFFRLCVRFVGIFFTVLVRIVALLVVGVLLVIIALAVLVFFNVLVVRYVGNDNVALVVIIELVVGIGGIVFLVGYVVLDFLVEFFFFVLLLNSIISFCRFSGRCP